MNNKLLFLLNIVGLSILSALIVIGTMLYNNGAASIHGDVVTFDVTRLANAQRAVAAGLLTDKDDTLITLARLSKETENLIAEAAREGTIILVKQAVVAGSIPDITDKVLERLGLPTNVPTVDPLKYLTDVAPTELSQGYSEAFVEQREKEARRYNENAHRKYLDAQDTEVLP